MTTLVFKNIGCDTKVNLLVLCLCTSLAGSPATHWDLLQNQYIFSMFFKSDCVGLNILTCVKVMVKAGVSRAREEGKVNKNVKN